MANTDQPHVPRCLQVHDGCCAAGARGREEEGAAQVVFGSDGQPVAQQHLHSASPHQRKPHPARHPAHHPVLFLPQQHAYRYACTASRVQHVVRQITKTEVNVVTISGTFRSSFHRT